MDGHSQGNLSGALGEEVFMMGMERNSDLVTLCCYAPLFVNAKHRNWPHSMFIHNSDMVYGTPSYHVFKMFSETRGDRVLPCAVESPKVRKRIMLAGGVGVGTWATQIEARDVRVLSGAQPLTVVANAADWAAWKKETGQWEVNQEGSFVQSGDKPLTCARIGTKDWNNYSYTLKVRKTGGQDGAIMYFAHQNAGDNFLLHLGAFGNKVALIERRVNGKRDEITLREPFTMEIGRWYEVKIDLGTERLRCFVDGALLFDLPMDQVTAEEEHDQVFASASRTNDGRIYLRAVNISEFPINAAFTLPGVGLLAADGSVSWMSGKEPRLENSFEAPEKINQQTKLIKLGGTEFTYTLPPYSLTTFSLRQRK
jgi:alpha-L-arabinofuranosidase